VVATGDGPTDDNSQRTSQAGAHWYINHVVSDSSRLIVATVNTYFGRAVIEDRGLETVANADVLLMQELFNPTEYELEQSLHRQGFELITAGGHFGLGIALRSSSAFAYTGEPVRSTVLQQAGSIERTLVARFAKPQLEYSDLGVLAASLDTPDGRRMTVATTHLPVVTSFRQRGRFLTQLPLELADPYYDGLLVLTGDMNHWPHARKADLAFRRAAALTAVDLGNEITWPSRTTSYVGGKLSRLAGGQLDDILYRGGGLEFTHKEVVDVASDHRAVVATFTISTNSST
jgi:endonuclease/exonuclease/phosphatase family metal-dependent hydrolase